MVKIRGIVFLSLLNWVCAFFSLFKDNKAYEDNSEFYMECHTEPFLKT